MNIDKEKLKALAEAAQNDSGDYAALNDYGMAVPPAVTLALLAERKTIAAAYVRAGEREHALRVELHNARQQLAERDALLLRITGSDHQDSLRAIGEAAALSASAGPKCSKCGDSGVIDDKEIDELPGGHFTERGLVACPDCEDLSAPVSSTSDKYKAELYDEVWQLARDMGFGNVTDALMKLQSQLQGKKFR